MSQAVLRVVEREDSDKKRALDAALSQIDRASTLGQRVEDVNRSFTEIAATFVRVNEGLKERKLDAIRVLSKEEYDKRQAGGGTSKGPLQVSLW